MFLPMGYTLGSPSSHEGNSLASQANIKNKSNLNNGYSRKRVHASNLNTDFKMFKCKKKFMNSFLFHFIIYKILPWKI